MLGVVATELETLAPIFARFSAEEHYGGPELRTLSHSASMRSPCSLNTPIPAIA